MEKQEIKTEEESIIQDSVLVDVADMSGYDKNLRTARIWLYVLAGLQFAMSLYEYFTIDDNSLAAISFGIDAFVALAFLMLGLWSRKKPVPAFLTALIFYILLFVVLGILDPVSIFKGIVIKILVIIAVAKGYKDALEYEETKRSLGIIQ